MVDMLGMAHMLVTTYYFIIMPKLAYSGLFSQFEVNSLERIHLADSLELIHLADSLILKN